MEASGDEERDHREADGNASGRCQHLPAVAPRAIHTGGTALGNQGRVKLSRVRIGTGQCSASSLGIGLKRICASTGKTR